MIVQELDRQLVELFVRWNAIDGNLDTSLTSADVKAADARGQTLLATTPTAVTARYDRRVGRVVTALSKGLGIGFKPHDAQGLEEARPAQLADIEISP